MNISGRYNCLECVPYGIRKTHKGIPLFIDGKKYCPTCDKYLPIEDFYHIGTKIHSYCKVCFNEYSLKKHRDLRKEVMIKLGGIKCAECGCDVYEILEINHINGNGADERKVKSTKKFLRDIYYDKVDISEYNVLCKICNTEHYVRDIIGIKGHIIKWMKESDAPVTQSDSVPDS